MTTWEELTNDDDLYLTDSEGYHILDVDGFHILIGNNTTTWNEI